MRLSEFAIAIEKASEIPCGTWFIDPEDEKFTDDAGKLIFPHACVAKIGSGGGEDSDNSRYAPSASAQMYLAMKKNGWQEEIEEKMDKALEKVAGPFTYEMGYDKVEAVIIKIYNFEYWE